ncbi:MAG: ATP-dependent DNA helicase RecG [Alistipes sp.]|nr:ATP-dependent DNA helicase RecG [Alistipes sp.]
MGSVLLNSIKYVHGVGEARAKLLEKELGVATLGDMLYHFPFRYIDRSRTYKIGEITENNTSAYIQLRARVVGKAIAGEGRKQRYTVMVADDTGRAEMVWFKGIKWIDKVIEHNREYIIFGRPSFFRGDLSLIHPEIESVEKALSRPRESGLQGIYSTTERLSTTLGTKGIYNIMCEVWNLVRGKIVDYMPDYLRKAHGLISLEEALYNIHFPQSPERLKQAQFRLKFDEFLGIQLNIQAHRSLRTGARNGFIFARVGDKFNTFFHERLPFALTEGQKQAVRDVRNDCVSGVQMNRLLQGDVGSGKTVVALLTMLLAADNGFQSCMMVPTEILARQHYATIAKMVEGVGVRVAILTGTTKTKERRTILESLAAGEIDILIGTHALIEERVQFSNLGLVIIDEQHRFGVEQRAKLWTKNAQAPHILVMTATPIPRTLAMTLYGDLDVSIIRGLPPGRQPVKTYHYTESARLRLFGFLKEQIRRGRQIYIVYPLIKESEKLDYISLQEGFDAIVRDFPLPDFRVAVCHGQMKPEAKQAAMEEFKRGDADILVATSVIEVGVDVPNATVIVIESAERFGLAQLHQLRGRVGRGSEQSYCILMTDEGISAESSKRLEAMCQTSDGFELAELDLKLRGAGDINGTAQSGVAIDLKIANPTYDNQILQLTHRVAREVLEEDGTLSMEKNLSLRQLRDRYAASYKMDFSEIS